MTATSTTDARGNRRGLAVVLAVTSLGAACTLLNPLDAYGPPRGGADDAGEGADAGADAPAETCARARWPARPDRDDATGEGELLFALRTVDLGKAENPTQVTTGFDFDGVCTCPGPPSCRPPADAGTPCDRDGGIDEKATDFLLSLAAIGRASNDATARIAEGAKNVLIRVAGYNGGLDDTQVEVAVFLSAGTEPDDAGVQKPPVHDGSDRWTVDRSSLFGQSGPPFVPSFVDVNAYVARGWLVSTVRFPFTLGRLPINLTEGVLVARLARSGAAYSLEDGRIAGRWPASSFLTGLDAYPDPFSPDGGGICGSSLLYADVKERLCAAVDLAASPQNDGKDMPCDALGVTILFTAEVALFGSAVDRPPVEHLCGPSWSDDCSR